jgi:hypothetical protein
MRLLKGVEVARELGLHKSSVSRQARAWGLVGTGGLIDIDAFKMRRAVELNPLMSREPSAAPAAEQPAGPTVTSANAERTSLQAELLRLRLDREAGRQLDAVAVGSEVAEAGGIFRAILGALPSRLAVDLARESDPDVIERRLTTEVDQVLHELDAALHAAIDTARAEELGEDEES